MSFTAGEYLRALTADTCESRTAAELKSDLDLEAGVDLQAYSAILSAYALVTGAADKVPYYTGVGSLTTATLTATGRSIIAAASVNAALTVLTLSNNLANLSDAEVSQLQNIGDVSITYTQWGYLGAMNQGVTQTSSPTFNGIFLQEAGNLAMGTVSGSRIGTSTTQKFAFWAQTPTVRPSFIADPAGGATVDAEARTAIVAILDLLIQLGVMSPS